MSLDRPSRPLHIIYDVDTEIQDDDLADLHYERVDFPPQPGVAPVTQRAQYIYDTNADLVARGYRLRYGGVSPDGPLGFLLRIVPRAAAPDHRSK